MNIRIEDRINEIREKEKTWNLTRDEAIICKMYSCLINISESLVTYTKEYNIDSFENSIRKELEDVFDKPFEVKTLEDIMSELVEMPVQELPKYCVTGDEFEEYLKSKKQDSIEEEK